LTLQARRIYILPTRSGLVAAGLLLIMLIAGLNYSNSLALLLCFMLCGVALVSMHECHRMLRGLRLISARAEPTFAQRQGELLLGFENTASHARPALRLRVAAVAPRSFELAAHSSCVARVAYQGLARGRQRIDRLHLSSDAPLGLFRAWTWLHLPLEAFIYPLPLSLLPLPPPAGACAARKNGRGCGLSRIAIRRAAWPGRPMRVARNCWWRITMRRPARSACSHCTHCVPCRWRARSHSWLSGCSNVNAAARITP